MVESAENRGLEGGRTVRKFVKNTRRGAAYPRYLPYLTWTLLVLLAAWFLVWFFFRRPGTAQELRLAAYRRALDYVAAEYVEPVDRSELHRAAMRGMTQGLPDPYSGYFNPRESERLMQQTEGEFGGIGVTVRAADGLPVIVEVNPDGPAAQAGLRAGDVIIAVDGRPIKGMPFREAVDLIRGKVGTKVELTVRRPSEGMSFVTTLERAIVRFPNLSWRQMPDRIAHLELAAFDRDAAEEMRAALSEIQDWGARGLILDLRGNAGGLMDQAVPICDMFLTEGIILQVKSRDSMRTYSADEEKEFDTSVPIAVLVDSMTASAAEILAGALQVAGRAIVVGTGTVGKGSVTKLLPLPDGGYLNLTVARYVLADETVVEGEGVQPDVVAGELPPMPQEGREAVEEWMQRYERSRQEQLERAIQVLRERTGEEPEDSDG